MTAKRKRTGRVRKLVDSPTKHTENGLRRRVRRAKVRKGEEKLDKVV
jgi:hypothetical protein